MHNSNGDGQGSVPFLEIITRHMASRPGFLAANQASLAAQTSSDWKQTLLIDDVGRGMAWAQAQLATFEPCGEYVWILDDDDLCVMPALVADLKAIAVSDNGATPIDVVMLRMDHGPAFGVLPDDAHWGGPPRWGYIGVSAFVVRRELWQSCAFAWRTANYNSDFAFAAALFSKEPTVYWFDCVASKVQRISLGAAE